MRKIFSKVGIMSLLTAFGIISLPASSFAYQYFGSLFTDYKMEGGISSGYYWNQAPSSVTVGSRTYNFNSAFNTGISEWNSKTEANFSVGGSSIPFHKVRMNGGKYGIIGLYGWTDLYMNNQLIGSGKTGGSPSGDWDQGYAYLNADDLNYMSKDQTAAVGVARHELGHVLGLAHDLDSHNSLMEDDFVAEGILTITTDDVNGVNGLYP